MCGTSLDGVDAATVSFADGGPALAGRHFRPLPTELKQSLVRLSLDETVSLQTLGETDALLGELFADCAAAAIRDAGLQPSQIRAIGSHGITVRHSPHTCPAFTLQLGDAHRIAEITGIATVADFRRRDMAAGGQGAPLVPAFHRAVFHAPHEERAVLNLGGIANVTLLPDDPSEPLTGFDTGPGNTLLDYWAMRHLGYALDDGGHWAAGGQHDGTLLEGLMDEPYFRLPPPKSTGKELFSPDWLESHLQQVEPTPSPQDVQATLARLTVHTVIQDLRRFGPYTQRVLVCGGGVHNGHLMTLLRESLPCPVESTAVYGVDPDWVEAMAFAWLARQTLLGLPGNEPEVTGAERPVVLGALCPGRSG